MKKDKENREIKIDKEIIIESIEEEEMIKAVKQVKCKGLSWEFIAG